MKKVFPLLSLFLFCFLSIINIILIASSEKPNRIYFITLVIWFSVVAIAQFSYSLTQLILSYKKKEEIHIKRSIVNLSSYLISLLFILVEYCCYEVWYYDKNATASWNSAITYSLNILVILIFATHVGILAFEHYKSKSNEKEEANLQE